MKVKLTWNPPQISNKEALYSWDVEYAAEVHSGSVEKSGVRKPARSWVYKAVTQYISIPDAFRNNFIATKNLDLAFADTVWDLQRAFNTAIEQPIYYWPNETHRQNGEIVGSPRNIVDTTALKNSLTVNF